MGDISELRGLLVVGTFLTILVLFIAFIPASFLVTSQDQRTIQAPDYFEAVDLQNFVDTENKTMDGSDPQWYGYYRYSFDLGGWDLQLEYKLTGEVRLYQAEYWWIFQTGRHLMTFYETQNGVAITTSPYHILTDDLLDTYFEEDMGNTPLLAKRVGILQIWTFFAYNVSEYSSFQEAFPTGDCVIFLGIGFDQTNTTYNAWDVIGMLLFFQLPNTHIILNAIMAIPIWIATVYITFILILRAIGAIFGGGA